MSDTTYTLRMTVTVSALPSNGYRAKLQFEPADLGGRKMSFSPVEGLPGGTEEQAIFNLFRGADPSKGITSAAEFAVKGLRSMRKPVQTESKRSVK